MATTPNQRTALTAEERKLLTNGLDMLSTSLNRSAKAAKGTTIKDAFETEARKVTNLANKINSGELEL